MIEQIKKDDYSNETDYIKEHKEMLEYIKIHDSLYGHPSNLSYEECIKRFEEEMLKNMETDV